MLHDTVKHRAAEALAQTQGDVGRASQILAGWAQQDATLLNHLTEPFLPAACLQVVQHVASQKSALPNKTKQPPSSASLTPNVWQKIISALGQEQPTVAPSTPRQSSAKQAATMTQLARSFRKPKVVKK